MNDDLDRCENCGCICGDDEGCMCSVTTCVFCTVNGCTGDKF